jgi:5-methyltetrahydrofolate--homocysteine methyltransferase
MMLVQVDGLCEGGVHLFLVEPIFDPLNAKAALYALEPLFQPRGVCLPVFVSGTIVDLSGRTLSGQTNESFWSSVMHAKPFAVGLHCALGAGQMMQYVAKVADCYVFCYPNAGLPNAMGGYDQKGAVIAEELKASCEAVGGQGSVLKDSTL